MQIVHSLLATDLKQEKKIENTKAILDYPIKVEAFEKKFIFDHLIKKDAQDTTNANSWRNVELEDM